MEKNNEKSIFATLSEIDCSEHAKKKGKKGRELTYLSWTWAWQYAKKQYPGIKYEIKHWDGKPYFHDPNFGIMVETSVTIGEETNTMWLPVMDYNNNAMKEIPYQVKSKEGTITVSAATMFDINKTIMRCLVKNLAMFGLGINIYAGEDFPSENEETVIVDDFDKKCSNILLQKVSECSSKDELLTLWNENQTIIKNDPSLSGAFTKRKKEL